MDEIITILDTLSPHLNPRTLRQLTLIVEAVLAMTGRVTMLGVSRWTEKGGSYRTVQRFFKGKIDWPTLRWQLIKPHTTEMKGAWLLVGDEVMVTKSGKHTHGLGIFFFNFQQGVARPVFFEPVIGVGGNPGRLPFDHRTTGARRCPGIRPQSRQA
ncbi:MAG: transposase [Methylococcales bacterium]|nr:transposase [Methylococcales bacterium]